MLGGSWPPHCVLHIRCMPKRRQVDPSPRNIESISPTYGVLISVQYIAPYNNAWSGQSRSPIHAFDELIRCTLLNSCAYKAKLTNSSYDQGDTHANGSKIACRSCLPTG
nr:putative integron gene cassette protein [uncultured bacterium]